MALEAIFVLATLALVVIGITYAVRGRRAGADRGSSDGTAGTFSGDAGAGHHGCSAADASGDGGGCGDGGGGGGE
jgi:hypothetical protein